MLKVNLEKQLMKQNKSLVSAKELLQIKEYDKIGAIAEDESLKRVFGENAAKLGKSVKSRMDRLFKETSKYDQQRVFHISQIEKLCKKYHLKFLPSIMFKGSIDAELPSKISQFEIANGIILKEWNEYNKFNIWIEETKFDNGSTYIAAPASSFNLMEKPKDPLLFHRINDDYYYLIHKWGNDLSVFRSLIKYFTNKFFCYLFVAIPAIILLTIGFYYGKLDKDGYADSALNIGIGTSIGLGIYTIIAFIVGIRFKKKVKWNSMFRND